MIGRVDAAFLAWFQGWVDLAQRRPAVLCRWCVLASVLTVLAQWWLEAPEGWRLATTGIGVLAMLVLTYSDVLLAAVIGPVWVRKFYLFLGAVQLLIAGVLAGLFLEPDPARGAALLSFVPTIAYVYFAGCRPPRPRPPRRAALSSLARGGA